MKKESRKKYPDNWQFISSYIRFERAKNRCEICNLHNGVIIKRRRNGYYNILTFEQLTEIQDFIKRFNIDEKKSLKKLGLTKIILTVAHLDHDEKNNDYTNLMALCQRCHLNHDRKDNFFRYKYHKAKPIPYPRLPD